MKQAIPKKTTNRSVFALKFAHRIREGLFILSIAFGVFLFISFASYHSSDPGWSSTGMDSRIINWGGRAGAFIADVFLSLFGYMSYTFPLLIGFASWMGVRQKNENEEEFSKVELVFRLLGLILIIISGCGLTTLYVKINVHLPTVTGGILGDLVSMGLTQYFNTTGSALFLTSALLCGVTLFSGISWIGLIDAIGGHIVRGIRYIEWQKIKTFNVQSIRNILKNIKLPRLNFRENITHIEQKIEPKNSLEVKPNKFFQIPPTIPESVQTSIGKPSVVQTDHANLMQIPVHPELVENPSDDYGYEDHEPSRPLENQASHDFPFTISSEGEILSIPVQTLKPAQSKVVEPSSKLDQPKIPKMIEPQKVHSFYDPTQATTTIPPLTLLNPPQKSEGNAFSNLNFEELSHLVEQRLLDFGVETKVAGVYPGPVITRLELELAPGVKVSKITGLAKDIARSLSVTSVRVVEVIPGKSVIGLEIPNEHREMVVLRDILESQRYIQAKSPVSLALGKDIAGHPVVVDLAKMPHLLAAGTTGSGKSVSINAMLLSMLFKSTPEELRLILIDPKMLELSVYEGIPHLLTPVITDMKDAANALRWCVAEMDRRYKLMSSQGVRNLSGYNQKVQDAIDQGEPIPAPEWLQAMGNQPPHLVPIPMVVVVADEFADMMMVVGRKIEDLVTRIAQKARAAGIHLILATQRPSVDVITGLIKANIPTRIAFQVSSRIDSRTILDQQGAEQLLGHGDMLYLPPGTGLPVRVHGAYVADDEVHRVVAAWQSYGKPHYLDEVTEDVSETVNQTEQSGELDPLYDEALKIVTETRRASISLVQRKLKIGYNRAATIMDSLEAAGVVSSMDSSGSREVLAPPPVEM